MHIVIAIAHIGGSIAVLFALGVGVLFVTSWETKRNQKLALDEAMLELGLKDEDLDNEETLPKLIQLSVARHSSELLRNRLSDLCGVLLVAWGSLGTLLEVVFLLGVVWYTVTDGLGNAVYAWSVVALALFFWVTGVAVSLICKVLTGRYPGQAKQARKSLAEFRRDQRK